MLLSGVDDEGRVTSIDVGVLSIADRVLDTDKLSTEVMGGSDETQVTAGTVVEPPACTGLSAVKQATSCIKDGSTVFPSVGLSEERNESGWRGEENGIDSLALTASK